MNDPPLLRIVHADLAAGLPELGPGDGRDVQLVLWWGERPLGAVVLPADGLAPRALAAAIGHAVARTVGEHAVGAGFEGAEVFAGLPLPEAPPALDALLGLRAPLRSLTPAADVPAPAVGAAVVICTRSRGRDLERCLQSIARADAGVDELLVVDNSATGDARAVVARHPRARWIHEPAPGLSAARNRAIRESRADVLVFVDDDTEVHRGWLAPLLAPFADAEVMATTGLVLPAALDTPSQVRFEKVLGGFGRGFQELTYDAAWYRRSRDRGTPVWQIGAGANMAVRRSAFAAVGVYDTRLGAGASGCSEDSELFYRLVAAGWSCRYAPASVVFHHHREDEDALARQAHSYIRGHVSALFVQYARHGDAGNLRRALLHLPRWFATRGLEEAWRRLVAALGGVPSQPSRPALSELTGYARGLAYLPLVLDRPSAGGKARLAVFLRRNPFERPLTEGFFYREKMRAIHRVAPESSPREILEVGGGRSGMARILYPEARITTVDLDPAYADAPVNQDPAVTFVAADATQLPFADASFDVVTMLDVLEHISDDRAAAAEAMRVLRPGGHVVVSSPNLRWRSPYHRVMRSFCPTDQDMIERWGHVRRGYSLQDYAALFGSPPEAHADFINPVTVIGHDVAFSNLPARVRRGLLYLLSPLVWAGYLLQPRAGRGTETAARWRRPGG